MSDITIESHTESASETDASVPYQVPELKKVAEEAASVFDGVEDLLKAPVRIEAKTVALTPTHVIVEVGGVERFISYRDFIEIIQSSVALVETEQEASIGVSLPQGTFFWSKSKNELKISCYYPGAKRNILYGSNKMEILAPNIIVSHQLQLVNGVKEYSVVGSKYFCTDLTYGNLPKTFLFNVTDRMRIWLLPMSNTYQEGHMCYGNNQMPLRFPADNLRGLNWYFQFLWETPFNNDLGIRASPEYGVGEWYSLLQRKAERNEPFPYELLRGYTRP